MLDRTQEQALMKRVAKGDKTAFRDLALLYQKPLTSFCLSMMNGHEAFAEDVVQQTLITWWQKAPLWDVDKGKLQAWVFTIAANKCKDYLKRSHIHQAIEEADIVVDDNSVLKLKKSSQRSHILKAMSKLNAKQKQVIWLYYFGEMKQADIATSLQMTVKNVEVNLYRAKKVMNEFLKDEKENLL